MRHGGAMLAAFLGIATVALVAVGTVWPGKSALVYAGGQRLLQSSGTPEEAARNLGDEIRLNDWGKAYASLANKSQFTESEFVEDVTGYYPNLRTYSSLDHFDLRPLRASSDEATMQLTLDWSTVVGTLSDTRELQLAREGDRWAVDWPMGKRPVVPPQVIPVEYLRWDLINRGPGDDWGVQNVDAPTVRIVDMHPLQRAEGVVVMGELLNEDVVPAYVSVTATLQGKGQSVIATESAFDKISHLLLPKQVTPFLIDFPDVSLSQVSSIRMNPFSTLVSASADPVIAIDNQRLNPAPDASLNGQLTNESGQVVNVAHVLGTLYDKNGQLVWVVDQYVDRALPPQTPVAFNIPVPEDLAGKVSSERTVVATYSFGGSL
jgi:hypothetical protein